MKITPGMLVRIEPPPYNVDAKSIVGYTIRSSVVMYAPNLLCLVISVVNDLAMTIPADSRYAYSLTVSKHTKEAFVKFSIIAHQFTIVTSST